MSFIFKVVFKNYFVKQVLLIAGGTAGAQAISMLVMPFVTRLYGPEAFGVFGVFTALIGVIAPIAALTYPVAIVLAENDLEAIKLAILSIFISFLFSVFLVLLYFLFGTSLKYINLEAVDQFFYIIPFILIFSVGIQIFKNWFIRKSNYKHIAKVTLLQSFFVNLGKVVVGFFSPAAAGLILIYTAGQILLFFLYLRGGVFKISVFLRRTNYGSLKKVFFKYYDFPLYRAPQVAVNALSESIPIIFLTFFYDAIIAGYYSLARVTLAVPASLIGQSVSDVFYPQFNKEKNKKKLLYKITKILFFAGLIPYGVVVLLGPSLFEMVFGEKWLRSGEFARWLSIWLLATLFTRPVIAAIPVLKMQPFFLLYEFIALLIRGVLIGAGALLYGEAEASIAFLSVGNLFLYIFLFLYVVRECERYVEN